jgi:murein DD-endopeptidase MepM/ murein hydrolase activator NlpD
MREHSLLRPVAKHWAIGTDFLKWGKSWHYHFDDAGNWVKGQTELNGEMLGQHNGVDFLVPEGTPVIAPCDGKVVQCGWGPVYGNHVKIEVDRPILNSLGLPCLAVVSLAHLSSIDDKVVLNQHVFRGQPIGLSGKTGNATGPHLHVALTEPDGRPLRIRFYDLDQAGGDNGVA